MLGALTEVAAQPGEVVGRVRISVSRMAVPFVITPVLPTFRERHPRIEVDVAIDDRFVDIVEEGYDAGVRLTEAIERDMVQVRLTGAFRFIVVGAPEYLARNGVPRRPDDLLRHECITFRALSTGAPYAWELERGKRNWRVPVRGAVSSNDGEFCLTAAQLGLGLAYTFEPSVTEQLRDGRLQCVLEPYAATVPRLLPLLPEPRPEVARAPPVRGRGQGSAGAPQGFRWPLDRCQPDFSRALRRGPR